MPSIRVRDFKLSKAGNKADQNDDRYAIKLSHHYDAFAVADGATESAFSGLWARFLVKEYIENPIALTNDPNAVVRALSPKWAKKVWSKPLSWPAQAKAQKGAFATLLGLRLDQATEADANCGAWNAIGIGDTCVFQLRDDQVIDRFPVQHSGGFGNHPELIATNPSNNISLLQSIESHRKHGQWMIGDRFFIMTDALAEWFLKQVEAGAKPWLEHLDDHVMRDHVFFQEWIDQLRREGEIRNDDVTLLMIRVEER